MSSSLCRSASAVLLITSVAGAFLLAGCAETFTGASSDATAVKLTGNWQLSSGSAIASGLPSLSGEVNGTSANATALFHSQSAGACAGPGVIAVLSGSTTSDGVMRLSGSYAGGTLTVAGTPSIDGKSLTKASYAVAGGSCGFAANAAAPASANQVATVNGTYTGTFTDVYGNQIPVSTELSQTAPDANGNFVLSGYANVPNNGGCFNSPTNTQSAQVTGQQFNVTYTDSSTGNSLTTSGTVSLDAQTLTVGSWMVSGPCSGESGSGGTLTRQ